jgi:molybdopterin-guanine dinucleotide biosynthesis protein A
MSFVGIVLGGGVGKRFGGDKLIAIVDGETSIARIIAALREADASETYILTRSEERCKLYTSLTGLKNNCLYDTDLACKGPGAALAAISFLDAKRVIVVPGDAPWITAGLVKRLLAFLDGCDIVVPLHAGGFLETLMLGVDGGYAAKFYDIARMLCEWRDEVRPSDYIRVSRRACIVGSSLLTFSATEFSHINTREYLKTREPKNPLGDKVLFKIEGKLSQLLGLGNREEQCKLLLREAEAYLAIGLKHLARHALRDYEKLCGH